MTKKPGLNFSFSGLKTAVANEINSQANITMEDKADIAASFQAAAIETIRIKCERALESTGIKSSCSGGRCKRESSVTREFRKNRSRQKR